MITGDLLISWSIRIAMLLLVASFVIQIQGSSKYRNSLSFKLIWTLGWLFMLLHVAAAFHFVHDWSHRAAFVATENETFQQLGFRYGAGIYFNYVFVVAWAVDVYFTWRPARRNVIGIRRFLFAGRCYLLFIAFNGVVVFESGWLRFLGALATVALLGCGYYFRKKGGLLGGAPGQDQFG